MLEAKKGQPPSVLLLNPTTHKLEDVRSKLIP